MKQIIVFGATGGTGKQVVEQALQAGFKVTVVVRNRQQFTINDSALEIIQADVLKPDTFENALNAKDAIVSCLGSRDRGPTNVYSKGVSSITTGMQKAGIKRIICISAGAVIVPPKSSFILKFVVKNILQRVFRYTYEDMLLMENILHESNLNWTVIRAPRLTNGAHTGKYRTAINEALTNPSSISRADLADFIVNHLSDEKTFKGTVELGY
jgi:putative NADH-flavin reductase